MKKYFLILIIFLCLNLNSSETESSTNYDILTLITTILQNPFDYFIDQTKLDPIKKFLREGEFQEIINSFGKLETRLGSRQLEWHKTKGVKILKEVYNALGGIVAHKI